MLIQSLQPKYTVMFATGPYVHGLNYALQVLHKQYPHIKEVFCWSDGAQDYVLASFVFGLLMSDVRALTGITILSHNHTIPGEGKAVNDIRNGQMNQRLVALRQRGLEARRGGITTSSGVDDNKVVYYIIATD